MGLDMYLFRTVYVTEIKGDATFYWMDTPVEVSRTRLHSIEEELGYWRKCNAVHAWFVKNVQNGVDDMGTYSVTEKNLQDLKKVCEDVIARPEDASKLLPTQAGFFLGSVGYDEYYFEDLKKTVEICEQSLKHLANKEIYSKFSYHSSW